MLSPEAWRASGAMRKIGIKSRNKLHRHASTTMIVKWKALPKAYLKQSNMSMINASKLLYMQIMRVPSKAFSNTTIMVHPPMQPYKHKQQCNKHYNNGPS